jgi:hypothetical protein
MAFTPSIRECMQRLEAMADTPAIVGALDALNAEIWPEAGCQECNDARDRLLSLHQLAVDLVANIRSAGTPAPAPAPAPRVPAVSSRDRHPLPIGDFRPARPLDRAPVEIAPATGVPDRPATSKLMQREFNRSEPWFYQQMATRGFPRPVATVNGFKVWDLDQVDAWIANRAALPGQPLRKPLKRAA